MASLQRWLGRETAEALRHHAHTLSDKDLKDIKEHVDPKEIARAFMEMGGPHDAFEWGYMHRNCDAPFEHDYEHMHEWRDDVLDKYAQHIKNYYYNYKPEAQAVDPSIDPAEQQLGPMAQDIEQVNPAAVAENPQGIKEVDTGRLALMNAGAIADLARKLDGLETGAATRDAGSYPSNSVTASVSKPVSKPAAKRPKSMAFSALGRW
jgi:hypothetical protein